LYKVGDKVVYPHHGAGTVVKKESREVLGQKREYLAAHLDDARKIAGDSPDPANHAAWSMLANVLLNLDEAVTKE